jgi:hypothetical protein
MSGVSVLDRCERRVDGVECAYLGMDIRGDHLVHRCLAPSHLSGDDVVRKGPASPYVVDALVL